MINNTIVYYGSYDNNAISKPICLLNEFKEKAKEFNYYKLLRCPAIVDLYKKIFVIKATYDYEIKYDGKNILSTYYDQDYFNNYIDVRNNEKGFLSYLDPKILFLSEESSLVVETMAPFMHLENDSVERIVGSYDIGKHFRGLESPMWFSKPSTYCITRDKPMYYVKFNTTKNIIFKRFLITTQLNDMIENILSIRAFTKKQLALNFYYDFVEKYKYKRKYLQLIKDNLVD